MRQGDPSAMKTLYCRYVGSLAAVCARYVPDDDEVKDILHDSFIKAFTQFSSFEYRGEGSLKAWLTRIVINRSLSHLKQKEPFDSLDTHADMADVDTVAPDTSRVPAEVIHGFIRQLPAGYRTIFNLYVVDGKSHREIARLLGIKESTSASQLHRAKEILAQKIKDYSKSQDYEG